MMKPYAVLLLALTALLTVPLTADAQSKPPVGFYSAGHASQSKKPAVVMYACSICHHQVTAARAKRLHYVCPVDHGKLIPVKTQFPH